MIKNDNGAATLINCWRWNGLCKKPNDLANLRSQGRWFKAEKTDENLAKEENFAEEESCESSPKQIENREKGRKFEIWSIESISISSKLHRLVRGSRIFNIANLELLIPTPKSYHREVSCLTNFVYFSF